MKVVINFLPHKTGGGLTYIKNLLPELVNMDKKNEYLVLIQKSLNLEMNLPKNCHLVSINIPGGNVFLRILYEQLLLPFKLAIWDTDLLFSPAESSVLLTHIPSIMAIRNPNPYFGELLNKKENWRFYDKIRLYLLKFLTLLSSIKVKKVIFVSNFSREKIGRILNIPKYKTKTIYHGLNKEDFFENSSKYIPHDIESKIEVIGSFILLVSSIDLHKNYENLFKAYSILSNEIKEKYDIVIAGKILKKTYYNELLKLISNLNIKDKIYFLGEIKHKYIPHLYLNANLFVHPSYLETFGHPLVEAMVSGTPVIAANTTAIPEILGGAGLLFDPNNPRELAKKIENILKNGNLREELIKKGKIRANDFSWKKTAKKTLEVFSEIAN